MSKLLDLLCQGYNNPDFVALQEWTTPQGELGVYEVTIKDDLGRGSSTYHYIAVLNNDGSYWHEQYTHGLRTRLLKDAGVLARFAGAKEMQL